MSSKMMKILLDIVVKSEANGRYIMAVNARTLKPGQMAATTTSRTTTMVAEQKQLQQKQSQQPKGETKQLQLPLDGEFVNGQPSGTTTGAPSDKEKNDKGNGFVDESTKKQPPTATGN